MLPRIISTWSLPSLESCIGCIVARSDDHPVEVGQHGVGAGHHLPLHHWSDRGDGARCGADRRAGAGCGGAGGAVPGADGGGGVGCGQAAKPSLRYLGGGESQRPGSGDADVGGGNADGAGHRGDAGRRGRGVHGRVGDGPAHHRGRVHIGAWAARDLGAGAGKVQLGGLLHLDHLPPLGQGKSLLLLHLGNHLPLVVLVDGGHPGILLRDIWTILATCTAALLPGCLHLLLGEQSCERIAS